MLEFIPLFLPQKQGLTMTFLKSKVQFHSKKNGSTELYEYAHNNEDILKTSDIL